MTNDLQQRLVTALYGPGITRSDTVEELADALIAVATRRSVTSQASEGAGDASEAILHLLVENLDGFSVELVSRETGESRLGFSIGSRRSVAISEIIALASPSKRVERLETALKPFTFDGMNFPHGEFLRVSVKLSDIEAARQALQGGRS